ncbi:hypothetical protein Dsin_021647 [Dipteronia sinensis]|uniref:Calmodulin-binding protein n=1 Tax=Dipteronia sinensis TaxID=43782 RepID=A0AAE0A114_9ROSI|nr:hypothetical protein Dsin_021647 [Dipteronia sinensis]
MQELKADIREMKAYMKRLSRSASADWNINARSSLDHQIKKSEERELRLVFANQIPDKIFTRDKIRDERDESVQIKLIDTISCETVELDPLSSMEIEIVVLDGDFGSEGNENWTEQEFNANIVQQRKSKGPLVKGKQNITLRKGVGIIDDLSFSDNSSWKDCGKFRLGARVLQSMSMGQARIKEAVSQAFAVRDHRVKRARKHDLPSLKDEVWHLKKVKKGGKFHTRLIDNKILTVKNFKQMYKTKPDKLREILKDCTNPDWEVIVKDASCVVDEESPVLHQAEEIVPNLDFQPLATSTGYPVNAQGVQSISNFHPPTNGVSGRNSSQSNEHGFLCSPHHNPLMTESSQINNGPHSHFPAAHVFNAYSNPLLSQEEAEAYNNQTTGPLCHEFSVPHQESSQINNRPHPHFPAAQHASNAFDDAYSNPLLSQWEAEAYNSPTTGPLPHEYTVPHQGLAGMQNDYNPASSSQYMSAEFLLDVLSEII